jgi:Ca-activated chloride channel homolog
MIVQVVFRCIHLGAAHLLFRRLRPGVIAATGCACSLLLQAQAPPGPTPSPSANEDPKVTIVPRTRPPAKPPANLRIDVNEVLIPVTVTDPFGRPVRGLAPESFRIFEDGVEQPVPHLANEDSPLSVAIVFDASASMTWKLDKSREAIRQLLKSSVPGDEYSLIQFNDSPKLLSGFTSDINEIESAMQAIQPMGWTSLLDAIYLAINQMKKAHNSRHALVVLSDGGDNNSRYSPREIRSILRETDTALYAIGMTGPMVTPDGMHLLRDLAEETGGRMYPIKNISQLPDAMEKVSAALRDQYTLAYSSTNPARDGRYRKVQVKLFPPSGGPRMRASWRTGYYAP